MMGGSRRRNAGAASSRRSVPPKQCSRLTPRQQETSKQAATLTAIKEAHGTPIPETARDVDEDDLDPDGFFRPVS